jgi:hypothetical protein
MIEIHEAMRLLVVVEQSTGATHRHLPAAAAAAGVNRQRLDRSGRQAPARTGEIHLFDPATGWQEWQADPSR